MKQLSALRQTIVFTVIALLILGIGFSSHEDLSAEFAKAMIERLDGTYLWGALIHYIELPHLLLFRITFVLLVSLVVIAAGALALRVASAVRAGSRLRGAGSDPGVEPPADPWVGPLSDQSSETGSDFFDCAGTDVFASYQRKAE